MPMRGLLFLLLLIFVPAPPTMRQMQTHAANTLFIEANLTV